MGIGVTKFFIKSFGLKQNEGVKFTLLFFHSFFLGLFIAFYFVPANAVFIQYHGSERLPLAYIISGVAGYLISSIYSFLQKKLGNKLIFMGSVIFMLLITFVARISLLFGNPHISSFLVFIWAWPFISLVGMVSGGLALEFLNLIQVKRLFGLVNMGSVIASILGYLTIPLLLKVLGHSYDLLFFGNAGLLAAVFILLTLYKKVVSVNQKETTNKQSSKNKTKYFDLIKNKYFLLIFSSATISMMVIYIVDFGFLSSVNVQKDLFPTPDSVSNYLAFVFGGLKIAEMVISYFSSRLLSKYGVKLGLTILPISITIIVAMASVVGLTLGVATIAFLILMTLNKSMERVLRRGLDDPAFNVLYQPLPTGQKMSIQTRVGMIMQTSIAFAGIALFLINLVLKTDSGYKLEYFPIILLPFLVLWITVARRLYLAYKGQLKQILLDIGRKRKRESARYVYGSEFLTKKFKMFNEKVVEMSVSLLSETNPRVMEPYASSLLNMRNKNIKTAILSKIDASWRPRIVNSVKKIYISDKSQTIRQLALKVKNTLDYSELPKTVEKNELERLINSNLYEDKLLLQKLLIKGIIPFDDEILIKLLNDENKIIKTAAINLVSQCKSNNFINKLVKYVESDEYYHICGEALLTTGDKALDELNKYFKQKASKTILLRIIEIFAKIGSTKAKSILLSHINYPDRRVQHEIIAALYFCKFQASDTEIGIVKKKLEDIIGNIMWIYACIVDIESERNTLKLMQAIDVDREINLEILFKLLSFMYEPRIINLIRKNIIGQNTIFAIEIIDNFINQDIKQLITPLFDDISVSQKIRKLNHLYPQTKLSFYNRLNEIVIQDFDKLGVWTVSKAIELIGKLHNKVKESQEKDDNSHNYNDISVWLKTNVDKILHKIRRSEIPDEVFVCLFHTDEIVYSTAAKVIFEENPMKCSEYLQNMSEKKQMLLHDLSNKGYLLTDKIKFLKKHSMFFRVPENYLAELAKLTTIELVAKDSEISILDENDHEKVIIITKGELEAIDYHDKIVEFGKNDVIMPGINLHKSIKILKAVSQTSTIVISKYDYFNKMLDETEIIQHVFDSISDT